MKLSDKYRQNYCDLYPEVRNKRSSHIGSKLFAIVATAALTACGGGGDSTVAASTGVTTTPVAVQTPSAVPVPAPLPAPSTVASAPVATMPDQAPVPTYTLANPPISTYAVGSAQRTMFDALNQLRIGGGFGGLTQNALLDQAAKAHADYIITNHFPAGSPTPEYVTQQSDGSYTAHSETPGMPGFTGARSANRVAATGYVAVNTGEVIAGNYGPGVGAEPDMTICLNELVNSVFHRAALLSTVYLEVGFGIGKPVTDKNGYIFRSCVIEFGAKQVVPALGQGWTGIYPFDGQVGLAIVMGIELPDPVPSSPIRGGPVSIQTGAFQNLTVNSFVLRDTNAQIVNAKLLTRADSPFLRTNEAYLVPLGSLNANSTYFVTFSGTSNGVDVYRTWSFKTGGK